jgi:hypothetical protein
MGYAELFRSAAGEYRRMATRLEQKVRNRSSVRVILRLALTTLMTRPSSRFLLVYFLDPPIFQTFFSYLSQAYSINFIRFF